MSESKFDPKAFANYKFKAKESILKVLKPQQLNRTSVSKVTKKAHPVLGMITLLIVALVIALTIRSFVMQLYFVPSNSMEPTLNAGDRILVYKLAYGIGNPIWGLSGLPGSRRRFLLRSARSPRRMDLIALRSTEKPSVNIKRVIGLPGEQIKLRKGIVYINGKVLAEKYPMKRDTSDFGPVKIPADSYFVLGDNRGSSRDSRNWGPLRSNDLIGSVYIRIWPLYKIRTYSQ